MKRRTLATLVVVALFGLLSLVETASAVLGPRRVATHADWQAATDEVRAGYRPGDLIVFAPAWADQVGRSYLGDLVTPEMAGRPDTDHYGRIWEVSIRGDRAPETRAPGARAASEKQHGRVRVARFDKAPSIAVVVDFTSRLGEAIATQVPIDGHGDETPCYKDLQEGEEGFRCATTRVERRTLEVDYRPRRGVLFPADSSRITRLEFPAVTLGRSLVGYTAIHDYFSRKNADGPVDFAVFIDGKSVQAVRTRNADGWKRFTVDTAALAGGTHVVRFEVKAPNPAWRTFGFHAEARP